jgi:hypothetical protein
MNEALDMCEELAGSARRRGRTAPGWRRLILLGLIPAVVWGCRGSGSDDVGDSYIPFVPARKPAPPPKVRPDPSGTLLWEGAREWDPRSDGPDARPIVLTVDGREVFVGRVDEPGKRGRSYVALFDSSPPIEARWFSPPLDVATRKPDGIFVTATAGRIVATSDDGRVLVLSPEDGSVEADLHLERRPKRMCVVKPGVVRIDDTKADSLEVDVAAKRTSRSKSSCSSVVDAQAEVDAHDEKYGPSSVVSAPSPFKVESHVDTEWGAVVRAWDEDRERWVIMGLGRATPNPEIRWTYQPGAPGLYDHAYEDLLWSDGRDVILEFQPGVPGRDRGDIESHGPRLLVAIDAASGEERYRSPNPKKEPRQTGYLVTDTRVYVARQVHLDVFDRKSGASLGWVGWK